MGSIRTRSRKLTGSKTIYRYGNYTSTLFSRDEIFTDAIKGDCSCSHEKPGLINGTLEFSTQPAWETYADCPWIPRNPNGIKGLGEKQLQTLNWDKLPSSTKSGIIQIIAEFDDTLALFGKRFWQQLSYGSITWAVLPFVSDAIAVCDALSNLSQSMDRFQYEDTLDVDYSYSYSATIESVQRVITEQTKIRSHVSGMLDLSFQHPFSKALDFLGFHPDLATAWDLIPFSFVVDYLLPIGDFLESFREGWVKVACFTGWASYKATTHFKSEVASGTLKGRSIESSRPWSYYARAYDNLILQVPPGGSASFEFPSFREMFNILYLMTKKR